MSDVLAGKLTPEQFEVYATLYYRGPSTEEEIKQDVKIAGLDMFINQLMNRGLIYEQKKHNVKPVYPVYDVSDPNLSPAQIGGGNV